MAESAKSGGIRPWMFFSGLAVLSLVIMFSTGKLDTLRPLSQSEKSELLLAQSEEVLHRPASWNQFSDPVKHDRALRTIERIESRGRS